VVLTHAPEWAPLAAGAGRPPADAGTPTAARSPRPGCLSTPMLARAKERKALVCSSGRAVPCRDQGNFPPARALVRCAARRSRPGNATAVGCRGGGRLLARRRGLHRPLLGTVVHVIRRGEPRR